MGRHCPARRPSTGVPRLAWLRAPADGLCQEAVRSHRLQFDHRHRFRYQQCPGGGLPPRCAGAHGQRWQGPRPADAEQPAVLERPRPHGRAPVDPDQPRRLACLRVSRWPVGRLGASTFACRQPAPQWHGGVFPAAKTIRPGTRWRATLTVVGGGPEQSGVRQYAL
ncbi:hypothetical protein D3C79_756220 [compost metagenome]